MATELMDDGFHVLAIESDKRLVRITRSEKPFGDVNELRASHRRIASILPTYRGYRMLLDLRQSRVGRNEDDFEEALREGIRALQANFNAVATLMRSEVGRLQSQRLAKAEGGKAAAFLDEAEALRFLESKP